MLLIYNLLILFWLIYIMEKRIAGIEAGVVIDHITAGKATKVVEALKPKNVVSILMNVGSKTLGKKDVVKIEDQYPDPTTVKKKIARIAPKATLNYVENYIVVKKIRLRDI